jgi:serine/threonine protein kinase/tetratricopeptide (TPR) repeat protein
VSDATGICGSCAAFSDTFVAPKPSEASTDPRLSAADGPLLPSTFGPGQSFADRYTIVERIGDGGMGEVYKAIDRRRQGRTVALKLIRASLAQSGDALLRFRRELDLAQKVSHANVCRLHDLGEVRGQLYISMEYVDGQTLDDLIRTMGRLSPLQTASLGRQICAGLQAVHEQGIVHRDLKPSNVMVDRAGHAIVMDFGMAYHPEAEKLTRAGMVVGTLAYVAPEQARGTSTDTRSDVYSLGLLLYEMLTGRRPPGDGAPLPLALRDAKEACPPPSHFAPETPTALDAVVMRCLARDPSARQATVAEVGEALARTSEALRTTIYPPAPLLPPPGTGTTAFGSRPNRLRSLSVLLGSVVVGALLYWLGQCPARPSVSIAFCSLSYVGPKEHSNFAELVPLFLSDQLRARKGCTVAPFASARTFEATGDPGLVARQLDVGFVVQGQITVDGRRAHTVLRLRKAGKTQDVSREFEGETGDALVAAQAMADWIASEVGVGGPPAGPANPARLSAMEAYLRGLTYLKGWDVEQNNEKAVTAFREAIRRDPVFAQAHAGLALALWTQYEDSRSPALVAEAEKSAQRAVALGPSLPESQLALGVVELGRGLSAEASLTLQRAQDLALADDAVVRRIAEAYASGHRKPEAEEHFRRAIALRPGYWENYNALGRFLVDVGRLEEAKPLYQEVIRLRPESDIGYTNLAGVHIYRGEFKEAEPLLKISLQKHPMAQAHNFLGFVYYATGRFPEAVDQFQAAVQTGAEQLAYHGNLGDAYRQLGRVAEAQAAYAAAISMGERQLAVNPQDAATRAGLSMFRAASGRCAEVPSGLVTAIQAAPENPSVRYYAAVSYAICGKRDQAVDQAVRAIEGGMLVDVSTNPDLRPLLSEPSVKKALERARPVP